jgi:hypothetical protein
LLFFVCNAPLKYFDAALKSLGDFAGNYLTNAKDS